jgi:hypothetical protein
MEGSDVVVGFKYQLALLSDKKGIPTNRFVLKESGHTHV